MTRPFMRIPFTGPLPPPTIVPRSANTFYGAVDALKNFIASPPPSSSSGKNGGGSSSRIGSSDAGGGTVLLTGAGISVASGLADYRGESGTYTLNRTYRPIYYSEFVNSHEARKRYWARSYLGWFNLHVARPNAAHQAIADLADLGLVKGVITQNVDSFHPQAHPSLDTLELHGFLRSAVCVQCRTLYPRDDFQARLSALNPRWKVFLDEMIAAGALTTEDPAERRRRGYRSNPDGDVDVPGAPYTTFRYPPCPRCLRDPPRTPDGTARHTVRMDADGAWDPSSTAGVLKPAVVMFGESIDAAVKARAEAMVDAADRLLVVGSSLATYSAFRLVKRAQDRGLPLAVLNLGGVRGEAAFFAAPPATGALNDGRLGVRCAERIEKALPAVVGALAR